MKFFRLLYRAAIIWQRRGADIHAAALAYLALFAITPLLLLSITLVGLLIGINEVSSLLLEWGNSLDPDLTILLDNSVRNFDELTTNYYIPIFATVFFSTMVIVSLNSLVSGLNKIWQVESNGWRNFLKRTGRSFLFLIFLQIYLIGLILIDRAFILISHVDFLHLFEYLHPVILFGSTLVLFIFCYRILSLRRPPLRYCFYGALVASSLILFAQELVTFHISTTPIPGLFGAAGLIIVLLVWIYVSAGIIFYGAAFAAAIEEYEHPQQLPINR